MKKSIAILCSVMITFSVAAQDMALTGAVGLLNAKVRVQYEHLIGDNSSAGANLNYYFVNWTGPKLEGFYRWYFGRDGNEEGLFMQAKGGMGILSNLYYSTDYYIPGSTSYIYDNKYWNTFGGGIAFGGKVVTRAGFVFESHIGYHIWTPPVYNFSNEYTNYQNSSYYNAAQDAAALGEAIGWYLTTGMPLDFQMKFGWQF